MPQLSSARSIQPGQPWASTSQMNYIRSLMDSRIWDDVPERTPGHHYLKSVKDGNAPAPLRSWEASRLIDALKLCLWGRSGGRTARISIPEGFYYLPEGDGTVIKIMAGQSGWLFARMFIPGAGYSRPPSPAQLGRLTSDMTLTREQALRCGTDPDSPLYGWCCICGLQLTNDESIELGIGPVCKKKDGMVIMTTTDETVTLPAVDDTVRAAEDLTMQGVDLGITYPDPEPTGVAPDYSTPENIDPTYPGPRVVVRSTDILEADEEFRDAVGVVTSNGDLMIWSYPTKGAFPIASYAHGQWLRFRHHGPHMAMPQPIQIPAQTEDIDRLSDDFKTHTDPEHVPARQWSESSVRLRPRISGSGPETSLMPAIPDSAPRPPVLPTDEEERDETRWSQASQVWRRSRAHRKDRRADNARYALAAPLMLLATLFTLVHPHN